MTATRHVGRRSMEPGHLGPVDPEPDDWLIGQLRGGDRSAMAELYRRHVSDAVRYARRLVPTTEAAEDVAAEAFAKTLRAITRGRGPVDGFRLYLFTAVRRTAERTRARDLPVGPGLDGAAALLEAPVELDGRLDPHAPISRALRRLPDRWRTVIWLLDVEDRSLAEVARRLDLTPNATSALAYRARRRLRDEFVREVGDSAAGGASLTPSSPPSV